MLRISFAVTLVLFLAACDDPANVGAALVDQQSGNPVRVDLEPQNFETLSGADLTGGATRVLVGTVEDPDLGAIEATSYLDFSLAASTLQTFREAPLSGVSLVLQRDYTYGDSTSALSLRIFDLADEWAMSGARADTILSRGDLVMELTLPAGADSLVAQFPAAWVAAKDTTLRSIAFEEAFHGFAIEASSGNEIAGFGFTAQSTNGLRSGLVIAGADTVTVPVSRTLTTYSFGGAPPLPANTRLLQDGRGKGLLLRFDLSAEAVGSAVLNGSRLVVSLDTTLSATVPFHFVRPPLDILDLYAVGEAGSELLIETSTREADGRFVFDSVTMAGVLSLQLKGTSSTDHLELRPPFDTNSLDAVLVREGIGNRAPTVTLLVTPVQ